MNRKQAVVQTQDYIKLENEYGAMNYKPLEGTKTQRRKKKNFFATSRLGVSASEGLTDKIRL
jgi:hypothetical protein